MSKTIRSSMITFLDRTDERKLDIYIASNHPSMQIYNSGTGTYTPDWSVINLNLSAQIYLDAQDVTDNSQTDIKWYTQSGETETLVQTGSTLNISSNILSNAVPFLTYVCRATYQNINSMAQTTFTLVNTGLNGTSAPAVVAQYSADGTTRWTSVLDTSVHKYVRYSYDGGTTYTAAIKMVGEDGTSVVIKGTAYTTSVLTTGAEVLLYSDENHTSPISTSSLSTGDAYLVDGYLCVYNKDGGSFVCAGHLQGPAGQDGQSSYVFIRYATDANGTDMSTSPTGKTYLGIYTANTNVAPTSASAYSWCKFAGDGAQSIVLSGSSQVFKVNQTGEYVPTTINVTANAINTSIAAWHYSIDGGRTFTTTPPSGLSRSGDTVTINGGGLSATSVVIKALNSAIDSDTAIKDIFTVYKAFDGNAGSPGDAGQDGTSPPFAFLTNENVSFAASDKGVIIDASSLRLTTNVVSYVGTEKQIPSLGVIAGIPDGMNISISNDELAKEKQLTISFDTEATLGAATSNSGTITIPVTSPVATDLKLSWSKINAGTAGVGIKSTTVSYGISETSTAQPTMWQQTLPVVEDGKYLWTRTITDYTDNSMPDTVAYVYAKQGAQGDTGAPGTSVTVVTIQYQEGSSATTAPTGAWSNAVVAVEDGKYLWTKTVFSDGKVAYGVAKQGADNINVILSNESHIFEATSSGIPTDESITLNVFGYNGTTLSATTVGAIIGLPSVGMTATISNNSTTNTQIIVNVTAALTSDIADYGLLTIPVTINGHTLNKTFSWAKAKAGENGSSGYDAVTFQVYSSNGYALSASIPTVTLRTFAYVGDTEITAEASYQWYSYQGGWNALSGATNPYLDVSREDVSFSKSYMCKMAFNGVEYSGVVTVDDKNDVNKVFSTKPSNYTAGDVWVVGSDYQPSGVEIGTVLKAQYANDEYKDGDWITATRYDEKISELQNNLAVYDQYFSFDSASGLKISARDQNGSASKFSTSLTNERLSFNYGDDAVAYINGTKMNIKEAVIESPLTVTGKYSGSTMLQAPIINIGSFSIVVESNGSLSIVSNT